MRFKLGLGDIRYEYRYNDISNQISISKRKYKYLKRYLEIFECFRFFLLSTGERPAKKKFNIEKCFANGREEEK